MRQLEKDFGPLSSVFSSQPLDTAMSDGIQGGFTVVGYKGKTWSLRRSGQEKILMREDGSGPLNSIEVIVVACSHVVAKSWYEQEFAEGVNAPPDCFSNNGVTPDPLSAKKQNTICGTCRHNIIGSKITPAGKKAKACSDRKRMAVVPAGDIINEAWDGPMLLVAPPTSLAEVASFDANMRSMGYPYYSYVTKFSFDPAEAYPRFKLSAVRALSDKEALMIDELRRDPRVDRIIAETNSYDTAITDVDVEALPKPAAKPEPKQVKPEPKAAPAAQQSPKAPERPAPSMTAAPRAQDGEIIPPKRPRGRPAAKKAAEAAPPTEPAEPTEEAMAASEEQDRADINDAAAAETVSSVDKSLDDLLDNLLPQGNA